MVDDEKQTRLVAYGGLRMRKDDLQQRLWAIYCLIDRVMTELEEQVNEDEDEAVNRLLSLGATPESSTVGKLIEAINALSWEGQT